MLWMGYKVSLYRRGGIRERRRRPSARGIYVFDHSERNFHCDGAATFDSYCETTCCQLFAIVCHSVGSEISNLTHVVRRSWILTRSSRASSSSSVGDNGRFVLVRRVRDGDDDDDPLRRRGSSRGEGGGEGKRDVDASLVVSECSSASTDREWRNAWRIENVSTDGSSIGPKMGRTRSRRVGPSRPCEAGSEEASEASGVSSEM